MPATSEAPVDSAECPQCAGTGKLAGDGITCDECGGTGVVGQKQANDALAMDRNSVRVFD
jgi:DnaJ-class molecular chaperone